MIRTYSWQGPVGYHSMTAQIMLQYGIRMVPIDGDIQVHYYVTDSGIVLRVNWQTQTREIADIETRQAAGRRLQDVLSEWTGKKLGEWGYLIGMRPGKLLHRFFRKTNGVAEAHQFLVDARVSPTWIDCLLQIGEIQASYIPSSPNEMRKKVAVYIGIPYCPSHCTYCSFPAKMVTGEEDWELFTKALCTDVRAAGRLIIEQGWQVDSVYYGGGTPTVLPEWYFEIFLTAIHEALLPSYEVEYTVEAGRPDTMTKQKLDIMIAAGVNRVSVNPQTLQDEVLRYVHRSHGVRAVQQVYEWVRQRPFRSVNMDFIAGLPGQTYADMMKNMQTVQMWQPENVTVHSLAIKRNSPMAKQDTKLPEAEMTKRMVEDAKHVLVKSGYQPYYLYRQKYMTADLANIGYALPGYESRYNICMMEECMHVVGIGPGASSRAMQSDGIHLKRLVFPWNPDWYRTNLATYIQKREALFALEKKEALWDEH